MELERLLSLAGSDLWWDRARAGHDLSGFVGRVEVDDVVRSLLLDPDDTAVTEASAKALLQRGDLAALRLFASAWKLADAEHGDHLHDALGGLIFTLSRWLAGGSGRFRSVLHELLADVDVVVRDGARDLLACLAPALPD